MSKKGPVVGTPKWPVVPKLDKDGWPEWMWVFGSGAEFSKKSINEWVSFHWGPKSWFYAFEFECELREIIFKMVQLREPSGLNDLAKCWNRAVAKVGYRVGKEYLT